MKHKMFLFAVLLISTYSLFGQKPMEEDPYLLWQTTAGYSGFVIHPNGNIIANRNAEIFELDGNTGQVIKTFPVFVGTDINTMDVSKDGKLLGAGHGTIIFYDLEHDTIIGSIVKNGNGRFAFFPDNKRFITSLGGYPDSNLAIYNFETKETKIFGSITHSVWALATSPDGKYFATGGIAKEQVGFEEKYFTYLTLWDAQTLKPIKELGKFEGNNEVSSIIFSQDGKYVGFQVSLNDLYIYKLNDMSILKHYDETKIEYGVIYFCFLNKDLIGLSSGKSFTKQNFMLKNLLNDKEVFYRHGKSGLLGYNSIYNSFLVRNEGIESYDLNKIVSNLIVPIEKNNISIQYKNNSLMVSGLNSISRQINLTISDISGRVIRKLDSPTVNSELHIPIKLPNGTYLIHIQDGNKEYTSKFLVME